MFEFFLKVLESLTATSIVRIFDRKKKGNKKDFSGPWYSLIFDEEGNAIRKDTYTMDQDGDEVRGTITRAYPPVQVGRSWSYYGRIRNGCFFAIYWSDDQDNVSSGCWFMHHLRDNIFDGRYYRNGYEKDSRGTTETYKWILSRIELPIDTKYDDITSRPKNA